VVVDSLEAVANRPPQELSPPTGAKSLPWCTDEKSPSPIQFSNSRDLQIHLPSAPPQYGFTFPVSNFSLIVFFVQSDGSVDNLYIYDRDGAMRQQGDDIAKLRGSTFRPARCGGEAVEGEFIIWPSNPKLDGALSR
jgi:hypothetical protein